MNLSQLEVLVAIVEAGSLTEAAEEVSLTQSAVSYSLSKLEAELGVTLLERGRHGVKVTRIGEDVLHHARNILSQMEIIRQKTARERGLSVGKLRFGCVPNIPSRLLTGILRDFQHKYPDIELVLFEGNPQELMNWLEQGVIDIGTVLIMQDYAATIPLARIGVKVVVSKDHRLAGQQHVSIEELADEPLIGPKTEYRIFTQLTLLQNITFPRLRYEVSARSTIYAMVRENMGISIMPDRLIDPQMDDIVSLPILPQLFIHVHLATNTQSPATDAFLNNAHTWAKERGFLPDDA